jgi:hypothetical protein
MKLFLFLKIDPQFVAQFFVFDVKGMPGGSEPFLDGFLQYLPSCVLHHACDPFAVTFIYGVL